MDRFELVTLRSESGLSNHKATGPSVESRDSATRQCIAQARWMRENLTKASALPVAVPGECTKLEEHKMRSSNISHRNMRRMLEILFNVCPRAVVILFTLTAPSEHLSAGFVHVQRLIQKIAVFSSWRRRTKIAVSWRSQPLAKNTSSLPTPWLTGCYRQPSVKRGRQAVVAAAIFTSQSCAIWIPFSFLCSFDIEPSWQHEGHRTSGHQILTICVIFTYFNFLGISSEISAKNTRKSARRNYRVCGIDWREAINITGHDKLTDKFAHPDYKIIRPSQKCWVVAKDIRLIQPSWLFLTSHLWHASMSKEPFYVDLQNTRTSLLSENWRSTREENIKKLIALPCYFRCKVM